MMSSGFAVPTGDITDVQVTYDIVVEEVGCATASDSLACLRTVSADSLLAAANNTTPVGGFFVRVKSTIILNVPSESCSRVSPPRLCRALMDIL